MGEPEPLATVGIRPAEPADLDDLVIRLDGLLGSVDSGRETRKDLVER